MFKKIFLFLLLFLINVIDCKISFAVTQWAKGKPASTDNLTSYPTYAQANNSILDTLLSNYTRGLTLTYSSGSTIVVTAGEVVASNSGGTVRLFLQKTSDTNVTFSNIDTETESSSTTYYVYAGTSTATDAAPTFYISLSSSAPTGVTYYKRLGSFYNNSSSNVDSHTITNDELPNVVKVSNSVIDLNNNTNLRGNTISNGYIGRTTTGTTIFNNGTDVTCPSGCYITGGIKQSDANFTYFNYACP